MSNTTNPYETLYGVGFLDDLHNYFPAILYDRTRFRSVQDLLTYIQQCARSRFDLFSFGQRTYMSNHLESMAPLPASPPEPAQPRNPNVRLAQSFFEGLNLPSQQESAEQEENIPQPALLRRRREQSPETRVSATIDILQEDLGIENQALSLMNLMNVLAGIPAIPRQGRFGHLPNGFMEPVVIRPSQAQIDAGSTRTFPGEDTVCAICQDAIPVNQMARRLNACSHTFHISCIDQWFQRDVRCPTCRHDIRESGAQEQQQQQEAPPPNDTEEVN
jgi:hypothetical protein